MVLLSWVKNGAFVLKDRREKVCGGVVRVATEFKVRSRPVKYEYMKFAAI